MRVLHVGFGFDPWIVNGLVLYSDALMAGQVRAGDTVGYFFGGRRIPLVRRALLVPWRRSGVRMYEWLNSDLVLGRHRGTRDPEGELGHPPTEAAFRRTLTRFAPDVVHVHDLGGLPSSLPGLAREAGIPVVMTLHDYATLCPTVKLYDAEERTCLRRSPGAMCAVCCADAPADNAEDLARTVWWVRRRLRDAVPGLDGLLRRPRVTRVTDALLLRARGRGAGEGAAEPVAGAAPGPPTPSSVDAPAMSPPAAAAPAPPASPSAAAPPSADAPPSAAAPPAAYQRRRDVNVQRLAAIDELLVYSRRSREIFALLGVPEQRLRHLPINPTHVERLTPRRSAVLGEPLRLAVLNACNSRQKGSELVVGAVAELDRRGMRGRYRLAVHGWIDPDVERRLAGHPDVELAGAYRPEELDRLLEHVDVGLVPSVWEEVLGFVGLEFIAKGIPVIGNRIGGIPDYVREGATGWLNDDCSTRGLADLIERVAGDPDEVRARTRTTLAARGELIRPLADQVADTRAVYAELLARRAH